MLSKTQIKTITSLSVKKYRDELGLFVAEGEKLVSELLMSSFHVKYLYITTKSGIEHNKAEIISDIEMRKISGLKTPSSSLAVIDIPKYTLNIESLRNELVLALDGVQDPGNVGTIIRIADWFGIQHIICSPFTADCYSPKAIQATMGAIIRVNIYCTDLITIFNEAKKHGIPVYGTFLSGDNIYTQNLKNTGIIIMGSEGQGISSDIETLVDYKLYIPPFGQGNTSESLNVATATAITCSEFRRRNLK